MSEKLDEAYRAFDDLSHQRKKLKEAQKVLHEKLDELTQRELIEFVQKTGHPLGDDA